LQNRLTTEGVTQGDQSVLPPSVRFEEVLILFVKPAIDLNREFEVRECNVDEIAAALQRHREVRLPGSDPRPAENPVGETLGG
jgi:hypothetical protein